MAEQTASRRPLVALLTAGTDYPYSLSLAAALSDRGIAMDLIVGNDLDLFRWRSTPGVTLLNLRGDQREDAGFIAKLLRVTGYYRKLIQYALRSRAPIFHILWNNRFEYFDRTFLMLYYRLLRKRIVMTVHNVNAARRDGNDSWLNRATLRIQYRLSNHLIVHTEKMRAEMSSEFGVHESALTVIPFPIYEAAPRTELTTPEAKQRLGLAASDRAILFFGRITPAKGLDCLIAAFRQAITRVDGLRLIIAGKPDKSDKYWHAIWEDIQNEVRQGRILVRANFIPEEEIELYFKGADVLALPYRDIFQSGVLFLAQSFGLPVLASDAGSLKDDVVDGQNGFTFRRENDAELADAIVQYFRSDLYAGLDANKIAIRERAAHNHSWSTAARITTDIYHRLDQRSHDEGSPTALVGKVTES